MTHISISRRSFLKVCVTGSAAALLAACGKFSSSKGIQPLVPTVQPATNPLPEATSTSAQPEAPKGMPPANTKLQPNWTRGNVARERTLIFNGAGGDTPNCNPLSGGGQLLEGCAFYSATADKTILWLVESYQYSADATELTIKFRAGIEWSDGEAFTTRDVKFGFETAQRLGWPDITGVEAIDDSTLKVKLVKSDWRFFFRNLVYSIWGGNQTLIVPEHIFRNFTDQQLQSMSIYGQEQAYSFFDPEKNYPVVTGPYMVVKTDPEILKQFGYVELNVFDLRPDWWAVKTGLVAKMPEVERVITVVLEDTPEMQVKQFTKNLVDYCDNSVVDPDAIRAILAQAGQVSTWTKDQPPYGHVSPNVGGLGFNCQQTPFDDSRVRWAVAYAIDQLKILEQVYGKDVKAASSPFPDFPAFHKLLDGISDLVGQYNFLEFAPTKTEQLMQEAGYQKNSSGFWAGKNSALPPMTLFADGPNTFFYDEPFGDLASQVVEQLRQAGFDCQIKLFEDSPQNGAMQGGTELIDTQTAAAKGVAPLFILRSMGTGINDPMDLFSSYRDNPTNQEYWSNVTRWVDQDFIRATDELRKVSPDDPRTVAAFRKCMEIWYKNLPFIPLFQTYNRVPYNTRYWQNWPSAENPYTEIGFLNLNALMLVINLKAQV